MKILANAFSINMLSGKALYALSVYQKRSVRRN